MVNKLRAIRWARSGKRTQFEALLERLLVENGFVFGILHGSHRFACVGRAPLPIAYFWQVLTEFSDVLLVLDEFVLKLLLEIDSLVAGLRQAIDRVHHEVEAVQI